VTCPKGVILKTTQFTLNIGVNAGYGHENQAADPVKMVAQLWQRHARNQYFNASAPLVGALVSPVKTVYLESHGCPPGGEDTVLVTGLRNPAFCSDDKSWREAVKAIALAVGKELNQTTAYLSFSEIDFLYLKPSAQEG
jgi:hypothetical protein